MISKTGVMAGSLLSATGVEDAFAPLQNLISHIELLKHANDHRCVEIPFTVPDGTKDMKTLMVMLIQSEVFISDVENRIYTLNPGSEMAHKTLVFIEMGLKDPGMQTDITNFMIPAEVS